MFIYNIVLARFLNKPETLAEIGFMDEHNPDYIAQTMEKISREGRTVWGNAYIITTHGMKMGKVTYLVDYVLRALDKHIDWLNAPMWDHPTAPTLQGAHQALMRFEGLGSFLAAQVVADLKNTEGHPLKNATDWHTFVAHGPGSLRGASWFHYGEPGKVTPATFYDAFASIQDYVISHKIYLCGQDLQNCLCEFDKYCRVESGLGRSKRNYNGHH